MVIDSSVLIAILLGETDSRRIICAIASALPGHRFIAAPTLLEAKTVIFNKLGVSGIKELDMLISRSAITIEGFCEHHVEIDQNAYIQYHGAPAKLNFGDCFTYALAKSRNDSLLYKGDDFKYTDISRVEY